jgi:hypothetical protein
VSLIKPRGKRALDRILDDSYVEDLPGIPMEELRRRREETEREEAWLSYVRRMLHGRMDILRGQGVINSEGELDLDALVASLSGQMGPGAHPAPVEVIESPGGGRRAVERLIMRTGLDDHTALSDQQVAERMEQLQKMESDVSDARARVHGVQDILTAEVARRYRDGEAHPEGALGTDS